MPRLFTGLEIPADIASRLAGYRGGIPGARWIEPADYHVTLRFIGDVDEGVAREVMALLGEGRRREPLPVTLDGLGSFGGERPRAVFARIAPDAPIVELQAEQERLMRRVGLEPERRKFTPHVTLARLRNASSFDVGAYIGMQGAFARLAFTAPRFVLYSSRGSVGGGPYVVEAAYPFG